MAKKRKSQLYKKFILPAIIVGGFGVFTVIVQLLLSQFFDYKRDQKFNNCLKLVDEASEENLTGFVDQIYRECTDNGFLYGSSECEEIVREYYQFYIEDLDREIDRCVKIWKD